ncbi:MAG: DNA mismatch repair protein MutS [Planctomycetales bacterium]|nr:DNA mismatch repair protein MutS [Planctomycetales bacterium]
MTTPMMQQYDQAKAACGDAILLFRMGDFYELFHDDAKTAAKALGLTLTSRDKGDNPIPMAGFPHHQLEGYLAKLIAAGFRAAVCEQMEDPKKAVGIVKREITRVVTPGTLTDDALLDPLEANYLAAVVRERPTRGPERVGIAWCELSTGRFLAMVADAHLLDDELARIEPAECLLAEDELPPNYEVPVTTRPGWCFGYDGARKSLERHFGTATLDGFGWHDDETAAIRAAGAILDYLQETQRSSLDHIKRLTPYRAGDTLEIDAATRRSLELTRKLRDGQREGSLISVMDRTVTPMGARRLSDWLSHPLTSVEAIEQRLDAVEELQRDDRLRRDVREQLKACHDLERLLARVSTGRAGPRDLAYVGATLGRLPKLRDALAGCRSSLAAELRDQLASCPELAEALAEALADDCPSHARDGGFIRPGYSAELDQVRELTAGGKQWIAEYQAREATRLEANLKVGYNKVFGYYIELTNTHREKAPPEYIRKQTLKNAERYITPELKEYEEKVLTADERSKELELELFAELRHLVEVATPELMRTAAALSCIDVLASLGELAKARNYCRPQVQDGDTLIIRDGRHPVLDVHQPQGEFVPNDTRAGGEHGLVLLITGPNMAGKSTYIRQVALLTIMAQMGSFVPAAEASIGIADRVFARVGASDELSRGQSTFMVEMTETARILNTASSRSVVILDEIGRGTSTYDGVSLAWSIVEHIHDTLQCRTLFATHYHELTKLEQDLVRLRNLNVAVQEYEGRVAFLHKIIPGAADKSYGIHVARLAGVPESVNERATKILEQLESANDATSEAPAPPKSIQLSLFAPQEHPLLDEIRKVEVNATSPLEALQLIQRWQASLSKGS